MQTTTDPILAMASKELATIQSKNPHYSLRAFARRLGLTPSHLSELFSGKRVLTRRAADRVLSGLGVGGPEKSQLLKSRTKASTKSRSAASSRRDLGVDEYFILSDWYYLAILSLLETEHPITSPQDCARRLKISTQDAKVALTRLERAGLVVLEGKRYKPTQTPLTTTHDLVNLALRKTSYQNLELARRSLDQDPVEIRDFSAITMAIDPDLLPLAKEEIKRFRRRLMPLLETGRRRSVYRLSIQLFPLTQD